MKSIESIGSLFPSSQKIDKVKSNDGSTVSFASYLNDALNKTNEALLQSEKLTEAFAAGKTDNIHEVMIAAEKAGISLQFTMQIRNKIVEAYNEIMRMQI